MTITMKNLEAAFAGESQAYAKYRYFAKMAREQGFDEVADHFEHTAEQELLHSWGHLELILGKPSVKQCLELAIEGETYEFNIMYPTFKDQAMQDGHNAVVEFQDQIDESKQHANEFRVILSKAEKRFAALAKVEKRHAEAYHQIWEAI